MKLEILETILQEEVGASREGDTFQVPEGKRVSILVHSRDQVIPIDKIRAVRVAADYLALTSETEQYFVAPEGLFAVKYEDLGRRDDARPGFH